jgi:DNA-binding transcriptional LysR family regulator
VGEQNIRVSGNFAVNHGESLLRATLDGLGIAYMPTFIAGPYLADGSLEAVLADQVRSTQRIFALHPPNRNLAPKVRAFVDCLVDAFSPTPPWEEQALP